jgi:hypothetical protein
MNFSRIVLLVAVLCAAGALTTPGLAAADAGLSIDTVILQTDGDDDDTSVWEPEEDEDDGEEADDGTGATDTDGDDNTISVGDPTGDVLEDPSEADVSEEDLENMSDEEIEQLEEDEDDDGVIDQARSALGGMNPASGVLSPADAAEEVWERLTEMFAYGMTLFVEEVFNEALGTPTINNDGAFGIFGTPEAVQEGEQTASHNEAGYYDAVASENYVTIYEEVYLGLIMPMAMSIMMLMALLMLIAPSITAITRRKVGSMLASGVFVVMMIVMLWEFATLMHALSDAAVQWFLPDTGDVLDTNTTTYSGGVATALIVYFKGWTGGAVLALIHSIRHILLFVYPAVLPLFFLLAYWGGHRRVKQVGSFFIWQWYGLLVMNIPTAILLAFANAVGWQLFPSELLNFVATIGIFALAVLIPFAVSSSFFLIGLSMRGAAVGTASSAISKYAPSPRPASVFGGQRGRSAKHRLKRGGAAAASRSKAAAQRARSSVNSRRAVRTDGGSSSSRSGLGSSSSMSTTKGTGVTPSQRRKVADQRQRRTQKSNRAKRAREQSEHYRK